MKTITRAAIYGAVALAALGGVATSQAQAAHADETPAFTPYTVSQDWFKADATSTGDVWPQSITPITCGGIVQHDHYRIDTAQENADYRHLLKTGALTGPADDAEFHPFDYTVEDLPACVTPTPPPTTPPVIVPPTSSPSPTSTPTSPPASPTPSTSASPSKPAPTPTPTRVASPATPSATATTVAQTGGSDTLAYTGSADVGWGLGIAGTLGALGVGAVLYGRRMSKRASK